MTRIPALSRKEFVKMLERAGYYVRDQKVIYMIPQTPAHYP